MRFPRHHWLGCWVLVLALLVAPARAGEGENLHRYTGTYVYSAAMKLQIFQDGDALLAEPLNGQPPGHLLPRKKPGLFSLREADIEFQFLEDKQGTVTELEMRANSGPVRRLRRLFDTRAAANALKAVAVNAETSVNARVFDGYERVKGPDGRYRPETFAFGEGGFQRSSVVSDSSIEGITFDEITHMIAPAMAAQNYVAATDPNATDLVVLVYWGATTTDDDPAVLAEEAISPASHTARDRQNRISARLLGFQDALHDLPILPLSMSTSRRGDLIDDMEESRYWMALVAIDYKAAWVDKVVKLRWTVRYNMRSRGAYFDRALPQMTHFASRFFGRDSGGLVNRWIANPNGKVEVGETEVIDFDYAAEAAENTKPQDSVPAEPRER